MTFHKKLFTIAAAIGMWAAVAPGVLSAQTSGVGCDGYTRFLWRGTDSRISLWKIDASLGSPTSVQYGPYEGWVPVALTVLCNNYTYVMWKYTDGRISLWKVDPNLNYITSTVYGPYTAWIPESVSDDQAYPGNFRVLWRETLGQISIWQVDSDLNYLGSQVYGPYFGFDPHADAKVAPGVVSGLSLSADPAAGAMKVSGGAQMPTN